MTSLVTLDQAKRHLRISEDSTEFDDDLLMKMDQATAIVVDYIKRPDHGWDAGSPGTGSPADDEAYLIVQAAILKVLGNLFQDRGDQDKPSGGPITDDVIRLLSMQRDPSLA